MAEYPDANRWKLTVKVEDHEGETIDTWANFLASDPDRSALMQEHVKEAFNQYRYFGTLRSLVTWVPSVIVLTIFSFVAAAMSDGPAWIDLLAVALVGLALYLIYHAQRYLQKLQQRARIVSELAQKLAAASIDPLPDNPLTYQELLDCVETSLGNHTTRKALPVSPSLKKTGPDTPGWDLMKFFWGVFVVILIVQFYVNWCEIESWLGSEDGCVIESTSPRGQGGAAIVNEETDETQGG